jgi:signal transduction histidine kinase
MQPGELAELFGAFNEVTARLQQTHERLTAEVARLRGELRRANDELERSRRLAALGEMAAGIAHEVRNPLGSIGLYAEMLASDLPDRPAERGLAEKIISAVRGLDAVVGDVLSFSREMKAEPARHSASELLERAAACCLDVLAGVRVRLAGDEAVDGDAGLLHQALVNLIRNAGQAMEGQAVQGPAGAGRGLLVLSSRRVPGERATVLSVSDTGPGLSGAVMERMFNPFFTTRAAGTGLGLAIVHRIVDAHGGRVLVSNRQAHGEDPGGATVELVLPDRCGSGSRSAA